VCAVPPHTSLSSLCGVNETWRELHLTRCLQQKLLCEK
jgi:hypothetical protein